MTPQQKCVSKETAQRLKDAGFPQDTERWWNHILQEDDADEWMLDFNHGSGIAAPDAQELLEELPESTWISNQGDYFRCGRGGEFFEDKNLAEALAKEWLYLKENNLI